MTDEEKTALHNVTSGLYNRQNVRDVIDKALRAVCLALEIPIPEKKGKKSGKAGKEKREDDAATTKRNQDGSAADAAPAKKRRVDDDAESSDSFAGFSDDDDGTDGDEEDNSELDAEDEETAVDRYASRLGGSDDSGSDSEDATALRAKYAPLLGMRGDEPASSDGDSEQDDLGIDMASALGSDTDAESGDLSDIPPRTKGKDAPKAKREPLPSPSPPPPARKPKASSKLGSTTFLPSLMGGYLSGSESASDVDVAPRKKRLGQRQRQAIAERKHGEKANHVRKQDGKGRDSGWDARRGAVDGDDKGRGRQPWKKGAQNPRGGRDTRGGGSSGKQGRHDGQERAPSKVAVKSRDDQGSLHPSWEARKKAKETQQSVAFQGSKITF